MGVGEIGENYIAIIWARLGTTKLFVDTTDISLYDRSK